MITKKDLHYCRSCGKEHNSTVEARRCCWGKVKGSTSADVSKVKIFLVSSKSKSDALLAIQLSFFDNSIELSPQEVEFLKFKLGDKSGHCKQVVMNIPNFYNVQKNLLKKLESI